MRVKILAKKMCQFISEFHILFTINNLSKNHFMLLIKISFFSTKKVHFREQWNKKSSNIGMIFKQS